MTSTMAATGTSSITARPQNTTLGIVMKQSAAVRPNVSVRATRPCSQAATTPTIPKSTTVARADA